MAKVVGRQALKVVPELALDILSGKPTVKSLTNRVSQGATNALLELTGKKQLKRKKAKKSKKKSQCYFQPFEETPGAERYLRE